MIPLNLSLTQRIWLSFILLFLFVGFVIAVVYPISIQDALKEQTYKMIKREQLHWVLPNVDQFKPDSRVGFIESRDAARSVNHLIVTNQITLLKGYSVPRSVLQQMGRDALKQQDEIGLYELDYEGATLFYVVRKVTVNGNHAYLISYMWDTYINEMAETLWSRLLWILLIAGLLGLGFAFWLARYLRKPLIILGNRFEEIAKRNWQTSFKWKQGDEFGHLSEQFEDMRQNLLRYDRSQKTFIQHASHELKTPIMVISSYAQSVKDGILPKDNLEETMDVILGESERMEQRVKELIYYTKLDTLKDETPKKQKVSFGPVAKDLVERLHMQREDVAFRIGGKETVFLVDREQWQVLIENLLENALRYAESEIYIGAWENREAAVLEVYNDGETIPEEERVHLFDPFFKGEKGKFGLGLAIVKRITELHNGEIAIESEKDGTRFIVTVPKRRENK
ncbi:MAG TPA: HAMP domain-containing sensor histidine kinase [Bacillales bacterium]